MFKLVNSFGSLIVFSRRHQTVRRTLIFIIANFTAIASVIFSVEVILIILGVRNIALPIDYHILQVLTRVFF